MNSLVKKSFAIFAFSLLINGINVCKAETHDIESSKIPNIESEALSMRLNSFEFKNLESKNDINSNKGQNIEILKEKSDNKEQEDDKLVVSANNVNSNLKSDIKILDKEQKKLESSIDDLDLKQKKEINNDFDLNDNNYITASGELVNFDKESVSKELAKDYIGTGRIYIWDYLRDKYFNDKSVNELVFVKYKGRTNANIELYIKNQGGWQCALKCDGWVGLSGIGPANINCCRTPEGDFKISMAFGIKPKPEGVNLKYLQVKEGIYCCGDQYCPYFNKIIDTNALKHKCFDGEHLIDYPGVYDYGFWFDHNKECDYEKGFAFFFHCKGKCDYTGGCVSVSEENIVKILKKLHPNSRLCIYCEDMKINPNSGLYSN